MGPTWWAVQGAPWWRPFGTRGMSARAWGIGWALFTLLGVLPHVVADRLATIYFGADPVIATGPDNSLVLPAMIGNVLCLITVWALVVQPWIDRDRHWGPLRYDEFPDKWSWALERTVRTLFYASIITLACIYDSVIAECINSAVRFV